MEWALAPLKDKKKALRVKKLEAVTRQEPRLKLKKKTKKGYIKTFNIGPRLKRSKESAHVVQRPSTVLDPTKAHDTERVEDVCRPYYHIH